MDGLSNPFVWRNLFNDLKNSVVHGKKHYYPGCRSILCSTLRMRRGYNNGTPANQTAITSILLWIGFSKFRFCLHQHQIKFCLHIKAICKQYSNKYSFLGYVFIWMWASPFRPITAAIEEKTCSELLWQYKMFFVLKVNKVIIDKVRLYYFV